MDRSGWIWIAVALIVACLVALWVYQRRARLRARDQAAAETADALATRPRKVAVKRVEQTKHPIVLAHGWGGIDGVLPVQFGYSYFRGIPEALRARGHTIHLARVPATASIELRAERLAQQIRSLDTRVNIIAHSMGGLDARLAIARHGLSDSVASLTTIGTPHHGTPLADIAFMLGEWRRSRWLLGQLGFNVDGVYDVSPARMFEFNRAVVDAPAVVYANVIAAVRPDSGRVHAALRYGHRYLLRTAGPNDGVVPAHSQRWGETIETVGADHWEQIGWFPRFDVNAFYARLIQRLAEREL
jgi:triacylglycerol lipase